MKKQLTLCMVCNDDKVLLGMKKRGFGAGRWNGFGGKLLEGETIEQAAIREIKEEVGIEPNHMPKIGILTFSFETEPDTELEVHVYKIRDYVGEPEESEEMRPEWFTHDNIPFHQMWSDDELWFPYMLADKKFKGKFHFDQPSTAEYSAKILRQEIAEVLDELE